MELVLQQNCAEYSEALKMVVTWGFEPQTPTVSR